MLLGLDLATTSGFAFYESLGVGRAPRIRCGSFKCEGDDFDTKAESLSDHLYDLLKAERQSGSRIEYAAIEAPLRVIPTGGRKHGGMFASVPGEAASNPNTLMQLHAIAGAACAILRQFHIQKRIVMPATWRKSFIGITRAPANIPKNKGSDWLKNQSREAADLLGAKYGFHVPNKDAAEAVGIVMWLAAHVAHFQAEDEYHARQAA